MGSVDVGRDQTRKTCGCVTGGQSVGIMLHQLALRCLHSVTELPRGTRAVGARDIAVSSSAAQRHWWAWTWRRVNLGGCGGLHLCQEA